MEQKTITKATEVQGHSREIRERKVKPSQKEPGWEAWLLAGNFIYFQQFTWIHIQFHNSPCSYHFVIQQHFTFQDVKHSFFQIDKLVPKSLNRYKSPSGHCRKTKTFKLKKKNKINLKQIPQFLHFSALPLFFFPLKSKSFILLCISMKTAQQHSFLLVLSLSCQIPIRK